MPKKLRLRPFTTWSFQNKLSLTKAFFYFVLRSAEPEQPQCKCEDLRVIQKKQALISNSFHAVYTVVAHIQHSCLYWMPARLPKKRRIIPVKNRLHISKRKTAGLSRWGMFIGRKMKFVSEGCNTRTHTLLGSRA